MNCWRKLLRFFDCCGTSERRSAESAPLVSQRTEEQPNSSGEPADGSNDTETADCTDTRCAERLARLETEIERLTSRVNTLNERLNRNDVDIERILPAADSRVSYSATYVPEHRETLPGIIFGDTENEETDAEDGTSTNKSIHIRNNNFLHSYNMNHKNRGKCIVFSHEVFDLNLEQRTCADKELNLIEKAFKKVDFDVIVHKDKKYATIKKILKKLTMEDYSNCDCICFIVLSHGENNNLVYAKDAAYSTDIFEKLFSDVLTLVGKPKIIIIQSCRGEKVDNGIVKDKLDGDSNDESDVTDFTQSKNKIPKYSDFLIVNSSYPGYRSFRQWFIPAFCQLLEEYSEVEDLESILEATRNKVSTYESYSKNVGENKKMQIPCALSTLRGKVYLKKKD